MEHAKLPLCCMQGYMLIYLSTAMQSSFLRNSVIYNYQFHKFFAVVFCTSGVRQLCLINSLGP